MHATKNGNCLPPFKFWFFTFEDITVTALQKNLSTTLHNKKWDAFLLYMRHGAPSNIQSKWLKEDQILSVNDA